MTSINGNKMRGKWFCWMLFILQQTSPKIITERETDRAKATKTMAESIVSVAKISGRLKLAMWHSSEKSDLVVEILKKVEVPVVLNAVERQRVRGLETRISSELVVILSNVSVERVLGETLWNGDTRFLVEGDGQRKVETDFKSFWEFKVINVFGLVHDGRNVVVYSFLPYEKGHCTVGKPLVVDQYILSTGSFINNGEAFKDPIRIKNMNGCPINITIVDVKPNVMFYDDCGCNATTHVRGVEGNLMHEVARRLNFNATFLIALDGVGWGWIRPSPHGAVGEVFTGRSDFAIGLLAPTIERYESLDLSLPYNGDECITYGVPTGAGASTPNWITILIFEFSPVTWALIVVSCFLIFIVFVLVNKYSKVRWFPSKMDIALFMFSSCLGLPVKTHHQLSLRMSLTTWIAFSFIVTVAYKSSMGSKLTVPNRDPDINTFRELVESKLEFTGYNNMLRLLEYNEKDLITQKMIDRFKVTDFDIDYAVDLIASERKIAYVRHTTTFLYYALINPKAKGHIHIIKDCIILYYPVVVTKKHSAFTNRLNQLISRLKESGITKRWREDYIYNIPPPVKPFLKLSNDHMYGVFCILGFGYVIGVVAFFFEIIDYYVVKRKRPNFRQML